MAPTRRQRQAFGGDDVESGGMVEARDPARGPLKPIEDAPGSYVKVKS